jgi:hypothetical protein
VTDPAPALTVAPGFDGTAVAVEADAADADGAALDDALGVYA